MAELAEARAQTAPFASSFCRIWRRPESNFPLRRSTTALPPFDQQP